MPRPVLLAILIPALMLLGSAARSTDAPAAQPPTTAESLLAPESPPPPPATRPTNWLTIEGGDGDTLYRGWPIRIELHPSAAPPATPSITIHGPADVAPQPAADNAGVWLISPEASATMPAGQYTISVGDVRADLAIADEPPTLSPSHQQAKQLARVAYALASNDLPTAQKLGHDWTAASPSSPAAQTSLGDVLAASGNPAEALAAYTEAINLTPPGTRPPADLLTRAAELRREMLANSAATRPAATAPATTTDAPADEAAYYKLISAGDTARRAGKLPDALRAYQSAQRYHQAHKMKLATRELDEKLAYLRDLQQKQPPPQARNAQPQRSQPQKPQSTRPTTAPR